MSEEDLRFKQGLVDIKRVDSILSSGAIAHGELKEGHNYVMVIHSSSDIPKLREVARYAKGSWGVNLVVVCLENGVELYEMS